MRRASQFVVTPYRVGEIRVTGNKHFSGRLIRGMGDFAQREQLTSPRLRKALDDYNQNPSSRSMPSPVLARDGVTDQSRGEGDLPASRLWRLRQSGYGAAGARRMVCRFQLGNVLSTGQISYQFTRSFRPLYRIR